MIANIDGSRKLEGEVDEVAKVTDNRKQSSQDGDARSFKRLSLFLSLTEVLERMKQILNSKHNNNIY